MKLFEVIIQFKHNVLGQHSCTAKYERTAFRGGTGGAVALLGDVPNIITDVNSTGDSPLHRSGDELESGGE